MESPRVSCSSAAPRAASRQPLYRLINLASLFLLTSFLLDSLFLIPPFRSLFLERSPVEKSGDRAQLYRPSSLPPRDSTLPKDERRGTREILTQHSKIICLIYSPDDNNTPITGFTRIGSRDCDRSSSPLPPGTQRVTRSFDRSSQSSTSRKVHGTIDRWLSGRKEKGEKEEGKKRGKEEDGMENK